VLLLTVDFSEQFHESLAEHASTCVVFLVRRLIFWRLSGTAASQRALPGGNRKAGDLGEEGTRLRGRRGQLRPKTGGCQPLIGTYSRIGV